MTRNLSNREVVLGITGSIAAYKACEIASGLVKLGIQVTPALTRSATQLVGPASLEAITGRRAVTRLFEPLQNPEIEHIAVAQRAHLFLVAPATANILAKAAHGIADDWLSTTLLATRAPILFAPAMNAAMYDHPATLANIRTLQSRGCYFVGPESGRLACGAEGCGRLADPATIIDAAIPLIDPRDDLTGRRVLITMGGTREPIDPVRFISNRSSGKMGRALVLEALARGAHVSVITAPINLPLPPGAHLHKVESAEQMADSARRHAPNADIIVGAAAVADYRPETSSPTKHKRTGRPISLKLVENPDIIAETAAHKKPGQIVAAFAAETDNEIPNAQAKMQRKNVDLIVVNQVGQPDSGFGTDTLNAAVLWANEPHNPLEPLTKEDLATRLFDEIVKRLEEGQKDID